jgi:trk system potassium uptake protein TrkA
MRTVIVGAGEFGRNLAATFRNDQHDVVVVDADTAICAQLRDKFDVMTVVGDGATLSALEEAGIDQADLLVAVTSSDAVNLWACRVAKHFRVARTICRLSSNDYFSSESGFTPAVAGIDYAVIPSEECVQKILDVLDSNSVLEKIVFSHPEAIMTAIRVMPDSPVVGIPIRGFPEPTLLTSARFCGIVRNRKLIIPHGETIICVGDELYIAGRRDKVHALTHFINPKDRPIQRVIIAGETDIGKRLAERLASLKYDVRLIVESQKTGEALLNELNLNLMVISGDPTSDEILDEAGVGACDAFVSVQKDDEDNILSCLLAKRQGAAKVIALTNKSEYIYIIPTIDTIDCGFSSRLVASNSVLRNPITDRLSVNAILHRVNACIFEFTVAPDSPIADKLIRDYRFPASAVLALVFREGEVLTPSGDLVMAPGDVVATMALPETAKELLPHFRSRSW